MAEPLPYIVFRQAAARKQQGLALHCWCRLLSCLGNMPKDAGCMQGSLRISDPGVNKDGSRIGGRQWPQQPVAHCGLYMQA